MRASTNSVNRLNGLRLVRVVAVVTLGATVASVTSGCSTIKRQKNELRSLRSQVVDLRDRSSTLEGEVREGHARADATVAQVQNLSSQNQQLQSALASRQASEAQTQGELQSLRGLAAQKEGELAQVSGSVATKDAALAAMKEREITLINRQIELLERHRKTLAMAKALANRPAPVARPQGNPWANQAAPQHGNFQENAEMAAFSRNLRNKLAARGVNDMNVELRTGRDGRQRVAIVLPDSFPPGKATLAYNASAVKAVMGVGQVIQSEFPGSQVAIEGHTDSDPIRVSKWGTNENLSQARADAVAKLLSSAGVAGRQISTEGVGARNPLEPGSTKRAKSRNRRVEIFIAPRS